MTFSVWDCHRRTRTGGLVATVLSFSIAAGLEKPLEPQLRGPGDPGFARSLCSRLNPCRERPRFRDAVDGLLGAARRQLIPGSLGANRTTHG
jgi:hypothetical protein